MCLPFLEIAGLTHLSPSQILYRGVDLIGGLRAKYSCRETIHGFKVNSVCGNMCHNVVNIKNGPYFILLRNFDR